PSSSEKAPTQRQREQRARFGLVARFLQPIRVLLDLGFADKTRGKSVTGYNVAIGYTLRNAVTGTFPDYSVDYTRLLISLGHLQGVWDTAMSSSAPGSIDFTWGDNSDP